MSFSLLNKTAKIKSAYRQLFLDEHGQLRPNAEAVLDDLYNHTRYFKDVPADPQVLTVVEGGRQVVRHILKRLRAVDLEKKRQTKIAILGD